MEQKPNTCEYINLESLEYEFIIEEITLDVNRFEAPAVEKPEKKKNKQGGGNKDKKGKKGKKDEVDDTNLSKQNSKLSIYSIKPGGKNKNIQLEKRDKDKIRNLLNSSALKGVKNVNLVMEKVKATIVKNEQFRDALLSQPVEEVIDTRVPPKNPVNVVLNDDAELDFEPSGEQVNINTTIKKQQSKKKKDDKSKKDDKNKKDDKKKKEEPKKQEAKEVNMDKQDKTVQNKKVEDLLKGFKDKKTAKDQTKPDEKVSISTIYLTKHKYLFTLDPTKKLKLRELGSITPESLNSFFEIVKDSLTNMTGHKEDEFTKQNIREACSLLDNLNELILTANTNDLLSITLERSIELLLDTLSRDIPNSRTFVINILYTFIKYQGDANLTEKTKLSDYLLKIYNIVSTQFTDYLRDTKSVSLQDNDDLNYYLFTRSLTYIALSQLDKKKTSKDMLVDDNIKELINILQTNLTASEDFIDDFTSLKFFTKMSHLFDYHKSRFYVLTIKISKFIESSLTEIQNVIIQNYSQFFLKAINGILLKYLNNFDIFYENNESLYEEIFALMKYIIEDKSLECKSLANTFESPIVLEDLNLQSDDFVTKYIILLVKYIKYFEKAFNGDDGDGDDIQIYLDYHHQVLFKILSVKQSYIREKYFKIMEKSIEPHIADISTTERICNYITTFIQNTLLVNYNTNLVRNIKFIKEITKFYSHYIHIKRNILSIFGGREYKDKVVFSLFTLFYLNFLNFNNQEDYKLLISILNSSENFIENLLLIDRKLCAYLMKYYINEEVAALEKIIDIALTGVSDGSVNLSVDKVIDFIFKKIVNCVGDSEATIADLNNLLKILSQFIDKGLLNNSGLEKMLGDYIQATKSAGITQNKTSVIMYFVNKLSRDYTHEQMVKMIAHINTELGFSGLVDIVNELTLINDKKGQSKNTYLVTNKEAIYYFLQLINLEGLLKTNPDYFKVEDIEVEQIPEEVPQGLVNEAIEKPSSEVPVKKNKINFEPVLNIFINYIDIAVKSLQNGSDRNTTLLNITNLQEAINLILANDTIFFNIVENKPLLEKFIKKYIELKDHAFEISNNSTKELRRIEVEMTSLHGDNLTDISNNLLSTELSERISINCANFMKYRCKDQIVHLFKEVDIYKMFLTKDKDFLRMLYKQLSSSYEKTILDPENLQGLLSKAQNEEEDYMDEVINSIFSKQIISYLECPEEIVEFLTTMNDALKYDFKVEKKEFYNNLFSYFYLWKAIMSKIENGFKLYTSDKQHVKMIDSYKILLKFIVDYLEKNNRLYEMFLLISISLVHIIDDEKMLEGGERYIIEDLDKFDDSSLTESFDKNSFTFILSVFYKFVKIFPTLVKYYYDEKKSKLKNTIKRLITNVTLPKMLTDIKNIMSSNTVSILV
jgi:hypothetical protein